MTRDNELPRNVLRQPPLESSLREPLPKCRELVYDDYTFRAAYRPDVLLSFINRPLDDEHAINGTITGVADGKIHIDLDDNTNQIEREYGKDRIVVGHEIWILNFGTQKVDDVWMQDGVINATLFSELRLRRKIIEWIKDEYGWQKYMELDTVEDYYHFFVENCSKPIGEPPEKDDHQEETSNKDPETTKYSID